MFERWLLDAEWSLNAGNWMWLSCSAFFQQFFNCICPVGFGRKLDPNGDYVRLVEVLSDTIIINIWSFCLLCSSPNMFFKNQTICSPVYTGTYFLWQLGFKTGNNIIVCPWEACASALPEVVHSVFMSELMSVICDCVCNFHDHLMLFIVISHGHCKNYSN